VPQESGANPPARGSRSPRPGPASARLDLLKTLGDNTRYAIYLELARSPKPLATADVAASLDLHVNTVRPHLERMRDVGLLEVAAETRGGVGRPQHVYSLAPEAPSLGLEPPSFPLLAEMLIGLVATTGAAGDDAVEIGREHGGVAAARAPSGRSCVDALLDDQARLGFDPTRVDDDDSVTVAFTHCPYGELARRHPDIVCSLHCGMVEGLVESLAPDSSPAVRVREFHTVVDRAPCQVELVTS
jgi:predicted ArsR family transcriptional regulator